MKKIKICLVILVCFFIIGCSSQSMTKNVMNDIGGIIDINRFQYYISAGIRLTAIERVRESNLTKNGGANIKETAYRDIIVISKNTMGVLMDTKIDENELMILEVCFEEKATDSDKRIVFKQEGPGLEHKFYVVYTDPRRRIINYGGNEYSLETNTGERAYLKVKINKSAIEKERVRRVKGRKIEY